MVASYPQCCEAIYSSVSGLKAHLASCSKVSSQACPHGGEGAWSSQLLPKGPHTLGV